MSKEPAAQPTQPRKYAEFSFRKSSASQTFVRQVGSELPPPVSVRRAWRLALWSQVTRGWKASEMPFFVQELVVPESSESRYWWMSKTCELLGIGMVMFKGGFRTYLGYWYCRQGL